MMRASERAIVRACAAVIAWLLLFGFAAGARAQGRSTCDVCHSEIEFLRQNTPAMQRARAVNVTDSTVAASAHGRLTCPSCHEGFGSFPHKATSTKTCATCHGRQDELWSRGAHTLQGGRSGAACIQCHGIHDVRSSAQLHTPSGTAGMNRNCVSCHQSEKLNAKSPHADSVLCAGCHGAHDTQPAYDRSSRLWANQQLQTCGTCHQDVASAWTNQDVHARALLSRMPQDGQAFTRRPPACTDCHGAHGMVVAPDSTLEHAASERCAECHAKFAGPYADTYHGQAKHLGSEQAASCADCHTAHTIRRSSDPLSTVAKANLTTTCGQCHKTANAAFTKFDPHVDPHDTENPLIHWSYKLMNLLLLGTMGFFGMHTLLWLVRIALDARKQSKGGEQ
ncbi:MAG TPA: hypothetical protein VF021_09095 [Longimicrobiales bacterium]